MARKAFVVWDNRLRLLVRCTLPRWFFGVSLSTAVLLAGCSSDTKTKSTTGGSGGQTQQVSGGSDGGVGVSGIGGMTATGGHATNETSGNSGTNPTGGMSGGGKAGGAQTGGVAVSGGVGGHASTGSSATGGSHTVGSATGGSHTGGSATGGSHTVGSATGGSHTVGSATGGRHTGGSATGGSHTGGSATGGGGAGGSGPGGSGTGGSSTGGSGAGGSSGPSLVPLANAFCAAARSCCSKSALPATLDDCEAKFPSRLPTFVLVQKGTVTIDNEALAACTESYTQAASTCTINPTVTACKGVFVGTRSEGAVCGRGGVPMVSGINECNSGGGPQECVWTGNVNDPAVSGLCHKPAVGKSGDPCATTCTSPQDFCAFDLVISPGEPTAICFETDNLYCSTATNPPTCAPLVTLGGSCAADAASCLSSATCDSATQKCQTRATLGQPCSITGGTPCLNGLVCESSTNKCTEPAFAYDRTCSGIPDYPF